MKKILIILSVFSVTCAAENLLLKKWTGPYGGVPPFDKIKVSDFKPALVEGMNLDRKQIAAIADSTAPATFDNTILAFEHAGEELNRVQVLYDIWETSMNSPEFQKLSQEMSPIMAAFSDEVHQNAKLFKRIADVYNSPDKSKLTPEQQRLTWLTYTHFVLAGAQLDTKQKARVVEINQKLASLYTQFSQNELGDEEDGFVAVEKLDELKGLPQAQIDAAAEEAAHRKMPGKWVFANTRSSIEPLLTYSPNRALREKAFHIWTTRGDQNNKHNNNKIVTEILKLRAERAHIMGYPTYAHWRLADTMAKDPAKAMDLMMKVWKPAVAREKQEVADMQAIVDKEGGGFKIAPWDYRFYAEKVRKQKYDLDLNAVKPYLQLENIREAMFASAQKLYGFKFVRVKNVPFYHDNMVAYKVLSAKGKFVGLWYFDPYARAGKNSGAWMNEYRTQHRVDGKDITPIVSNNANFIPSKKGAPVLISWDDAETMFHEFGHALHGLNSNVTYESLAGTSTTRDHVEFPSQFNENYQRTHETLKRLKNVKGEPLPATLIARLEKARAFNSGFSTVELLASAIVDMKLHLTDGKEPIDPAKFEAVTLKELAMPPEIVMRHRIPHFGHVFSSEGYAAGYYSYVWSVVLAADAFAAFTETGDPYNAAVAKKFHDNVMSVGNSIDPEVGYRQFRGRDATVDAYLKQQAFE